MDKIFATDLDGTCIFFNRQLTDVKGFIEIDNHKSYRGYMHERLYQELPESNRQRWFVPVTTRSIEQYQRIALPIQPVLALTSNGGRLFVNGIEDETWFQESLEFVSECVTELQKSQRILGNPVFVDNCFYYKKHTSEEFAKRNELYLKVYGDETKVSIHRKQKKVYVIPKGLEKGNAIRRLIEKYKFTSVWAAGDSSLDTSMLQIAEKVIPVIDLKEKGRYI